MRDMILYFLNYTLFLEISTFHGDTQKDSHDWLRNKPHGLSGLSFIGSLSKSKVVIELSLLSVFPF